VQDSVPGVLEMFHVIPEAFIKILFDALQGFSSGQMLICALEIPDEHGT
jgi:hypothetical protein